MSPYSTRTFCLRPPKENVRKNKRRMTSEAQPKRVAAGMYVHTWDPEHARVVGWRRDPAQGAARAVWRPDQVMVQPCGQVGETNTAHSRH